MAFVCSQRSERQSIGLPASSALSFHRFSLSPTVIDPFFTSVAVECWILNHALVLLPLKVRLMKLSGPGATHHAFSPGNQLTLLFFRPRLFKELRWPNRLKKDEEAASNLKRERSGTCRTAWMSKRKLKAKINRHPWGWMASRCSGAGCDPGRQSCQAAAMSENPSEGTRRLPPGRLSKLLLITLPC